MIAWDTNFLLRYLVSDDDPKQSAIVMQSARREIAKDARIFIATVALCETAWVLRSAYRLDREQLLTALAALRSDETFAFEDAALFSEALERFRDGKGDFSDYMIGLAAKSRVGAATTLTFDKALRGSPLFRVMR